MIFSIGELAQDALDRAQQEQKKPDPVAFNKEKRNAEQELLDTGYDRRYPKLFDDVASYAALWRMGLANTGYMLMGGCGCGKTEAAKRLSAMLKIEFVTTGMLMEAFGSDAYYRMIKQPDFFNNRPGALIIDEIGTEPRPFLYFGTKYNVMADVLRERYDAFKFYGTRTIITTNLRLEEMEEAYGDRIESRCWEMFRAKEYNSEDFRKRK